MIKEFIGKEKSYFHQLHSDAQKLIKTIFLYNFIGPLFSVFIDAFLWRQTHDIVTISIYNLILYAVIPLGFYVNGYLLRKYAPAIPYTVSLLVDGIAILFLMFLPTITLPAVIIFSLVDGLFAGVYWANRNLLTLKTTSTHDRIYFSSIESASGTITSVIIPALIGLFITFGTIIHLYTPLQGYKLLVAYMIGVILWIGTISKSITAGQSSKPPLLVKNSNKNWTIFRWIQFIFGLLNSVTYFIPILVVLILIGNEATLGIVQSISAVIASLLIYWVGKSLNTSHRLQLIFIGILFAILGTFIFGLLYSALGVLIFFAAQALSQQFIWVGGSSVNYDLIDNDNKDQNQHYAYVCDQEIYLNGGRVVGILLFLLILHLTTNTFALRFAPVIIACTQFFLLFAYAAIEKNLKNKHPASLT